MFVKGKYTHTQKRNLFFSILIHSLHLYRGCSLAHSLTATFLLLRNFDASPFFLLFCCFFYRLKCLQFLVSFGGFLSAMRHLEKRERDRHGRHEEINNICLHRKSGRVYIKTTGFHRYSAPLLISICPYGKCFMFFYVSAIHQ